VRLVGPAKGKPRYSLTRTPGQRKLTNCEGQRGNYTLVALGKESENFMAKKKTANGNGLTEDHFPYWYPNCETCHRPGPDRQCHRCRVFRDHQAELSKQILRPLRPIFAQLDKELKMMYKIRESEDGYIRKQIMPYRIGLDLACALLERCQIISPQGLSPHMILRLKRIIGSRRNSNLKDKDFAIPLFLRWTKEDRLAYEDRLVSEAYKNRLSSRKREAQSSLTPTAV